MNNHHTIIERKPPLLLATGRMDTVRRSEKHDFPYKKRFVQAMTILIGHIK